MCKKCGKEITETNITRTSTCPFCGAELHSCINCVYYSPGAHYDCHETIEELVKDKERSNFCDFFKVNPNPAGENLTQKKSADAKAAFNALFGD